MEFDSSKFPILKSPKKAKSKKREIPLDVRERVLRRDNGCVGRRLLPNMQCWPGVDLHHVHRRSQGGQDVDENLVCLCRRHHDWVHRNVKDARNIGLLK